ncbi:MAG: hypothetical protein ACHQ5A_10525 [Opitutales bacterium]
MFGRARVPVPAEPKFPQDGILWHHWNEVTQKKIAERNRPVLLFVTNPDGTILPFLQAVLAAMPRDAKLREMLHDYYIALMIPVGELPEYFRDLGAGSRYHIAILSPAGLTPLATINPVSGNPAEIVTTITKVLEKLQSVY